MIKGQEAYIAKLELRIKDLEDLVKDLLEYKDKLHNANALYHIDRIDGMISDIHKLQHDVSCLESDVDLLERKS